MVPIRVSRVAGTPHETRLWLVRRDGPTVTQRSVAMAALRWVCTAFTIDLHDRDGENISIIIHKAHSHTIAHAHSYTWRCISPCNYSKTLGHDVAATRALGQAARQGCRTTSSSSSGGGVTPNFIVQL